MSDLFTRSIVSAVDRMVDMEHRSDCFDEFYAAYPRKVGKGQARKAYVKALKLATHDEIMFGLSHQRAIMEAKEKQFIPHPATWLNGERWMDEPEQSNDMGRGRSSQADTSAKQINDAARIRRSSLSDLF